MSATKLQNQTWVDEELDSAIKIIKDGWRPGDGDAKYIGLEHINQGDLSLNGVGTSRDLESSKFHFQKGDILFGKLRPYFRKVVRPDFDGVCSIDIWVMRAKDGYDQSFIFYFVANPAFIAKSSGASTGTRMPRADWNYLKNTVWSFPKLSEQKAIAAVLSSLDDKIELLRKQNETLEQIAKTLFHRWFVEFNFPDEAGEPYKDAGGKMVASELGEIPEGWRAGKFKEIADIDWGNTSLTKQAYTETGQFLGVSAAGCDGRMEHAEYKYGTPVISAIGAYCGRVFLPPEDFTAIKNTLVVKQKKTDTSFFSYFGLQIWQLNTRGVAQQFISKGDTERTRIVLPPEGLIKNFETEAGVMLKKVKNNVASIKVLSGIRDALLPPLMSGELRIQHD